MTPVLISPRAGDDVGGLFEQVRRHKRRELLDTREESTQTAQTTIRDYPLFELFAGGFAAIGGDPVVPVQQDENCCQGIGWNAAFTTNLSRYIGLTADFDGVYQNTDVDRKEGSQFYHYFGGVTFAFRFKKYVGEPAVYDQDKVFGRVLVGGVTARGGDVPTSSGLAMKVGGGFVGMAIRVEGGYLMERFSGDTTHGFYLALGFDLPLEAAPGTYR